MKKIAVTMTIEKGDSRYPASLMACLGSKDPRSFAAIGDPTVLERPLLALFCSVKCPGDLILKTFDLARELREKGVPVIGGFHSPMERECLDLLLKGKQPVALCPARSIENMRIRKEWRKPLDQGRLLILSPFSPDQRRVNTSLAEQRNLFAAALASSIFIAHAAAGSKTEAFCRKVLAWGKPVLTFDSPANQTLLDLGARPWGVSGDSQAT